MLQFTLDNAPVPKIWTPESYFSRIKKQKLVQLSIWWKGAGPFVIQTGPSVGYSRLTPTPQLVECRLVYCRFQPPHTMPDAWISIIVFIPLGLATYFYLFHDPSINQSFYDPSINQSLHGPSINQSSRVHLLSNLPWFIY